MISRGWPADSRSWLIRRAAAAVVALFLAISLGAPAWAEDEPAITLEPRKMIEETVAQIISILVRKDESAEVRIGEIEKIAFDIFDFTTMSKLVLARKWRKLDKEQRAEFVREFKRHLSRTYGTRLDRYDQVDIEVFGSQIEPRDDVTIKSRIVGGQFDGAELAYRLRQRKDRWRIIDVVIEGVSLVSNYRSQFAEVLNNGTIDDLLERLREKNFEITDES